MRAVKKEKNRSQSMQILKNEYKIFSTIISRAYEAHYNATEYILLYWTHLKNFMTDHQYHANRRRQHIDFLLLKRMLVLYFLVSKASAELIHLLSYTRRDKIVHDLIAYVQKYNT